MEALISTFHLDWKMVIAQLINFAIVFFVLYKYALKPLSTLMDERQKKIAQGLKDAEDSAQRIEEVNTLYEKELAQAKVESQKLLQKMKEEVAEKREALINEANLETKALLEEAQLELASQKDKMVNDARKEISILVISTVEKVLMDSIDTETKDKITKRAIEQI